ncbi:MAG: arginine--tRNA ligase [Bacilli bacterium]|nr:arginine--tRNA ligase [Bacilli bacterium]
MNLKNEITKLLKETLIKIGINDVEVKVDIPKDKSKGNYATNIAMQLTKKLKKSPMIIADEIKNKFITNNIIESIDVVAPGFINFFINKEILLNIINEINNKDIDFGRSTIGEKKKINIEFTSANPTGKLHLGHARGSSYGDNLCRILDFVGYDVTREYYINDGGKQIDNLGVSIKERYRGLCGFEEKMPIDGYYGPEIIEIAKKIYKESHENYIERDLSFYMEIGLKSLLNKIKEDLKHFRVTFDIWTSEKSVRDKGRIEETLETLKKLGKTYEKDGAIWLKTTEFGDEKDRVLIKNDGEYTYLTPDIAYHLDKFDRGYDHLINVFGADHHGYVPRLKAGVQALGYDAKKLDVEITQMVRLLKNNEEIKMSKRTGNVVTINDLIEEVGVDAARYFFAMRNINTQMDFDLDLATKRSNENPFYYVGYAYARICSILRSVNKIKEVEKFETIDSIYAYDMLEKLHEFKEIVENSAKNHLPNLITSYLYDLASLFHIFYTNEKILSDDEKQTNERLQLIKAVKIVIRNGLNLIGVEAPERM